MHRPSRRFTSVTAVLGAALIGVWAFGGSPAAAQDIVIGPVGGVAFGQPGDIIPIVEQAVPAEFVGQSCQGFVATGNNESVHLGNDLLIETGGEQYVIPDVEGESGQIQTGEGTVVLGETIKLELRLGGDGVTSGSLVLEIECEESPSTTAPPTSTPAPPVTTEPDFTG